MRKVRDLVPSMQPNVCVKLSCWRSTHMHMQTAGCLLYLLLLLASCILFISSSISMKQAEGNFDLQLSRFAKKPVYLTVHTAALDKKSFKVLPGSGRLRIGFPALCLAMSAPILKAVRCQPSAHTSFVISFDAAAFQPQGACKYRGSKSQMGSVHCTGGKGTE